MGLLLGEIPARFFVGHGVGGGEYVKAQGQAQFCNGSPEGLINGEVVGGGGVVDRYGEGPVALGSDALELR